MWRIPSECGGGVAVRLHEHGLPPRPIELRPEVSKGWFGTREKQQFSPEGYAVDLS
jgi:hypothetical protein